MKKIYDRPQTTSFGRSTWWDRLLKGRTGRLIITTDAPWWWNKFAYGDPAVRMMKKAVLEFSGVTSVKVTQLDEIKNKSRDGIEGNLKKAYELGNIGT
ncbi:MAG: NAD(P)H-dependent oxidoreductase [Bacteriovoracaceae bacterium]|nr:NAD(P)H-dependent oxidoreductase [Bacteriovoracaceae bacterium]